ncbi:MAG: 50S ribosomal protein L24 [Candidatus Shikimatogenerans sp. JK-2022]|nr:50S ribosomal protein L24 [Candidatus Shikimatogenerans bostrichidophilus]
MNKLKKGDIVKIISGKNKGSIGPILKIVKNKNVYVKNINLIKKHLNKRNNKKGKIIFKESKIDISNVSFIDPKFKCITKIGIKKKNNKKIRYCKKSKILINDN